MPTEGQIATGPNGQRAVYSGGQWVVMGGGQPQMPSNPAFQHEGPKAAAEVVGANLNNTGQNIRNTVESATAPTTIQTNQAPEGTIWIDPNDPSKGVRKIPGYESQRMTPQLRADAIQAYNDARAIAETVDNLRQQYYGGPGSTKGLAGLGDYLPTATNQTFDTTGQRARGYVKRALGFTGGEGNTMAESAATYGPYIPTSNDKDETAAAKIAALESLGQKAAERATMLLGGIPDNQGNITPLPDNMQGSVWDVIRTTGGKTDNLAAADRGATTKALPYPEAGQAAHDAMVGRIISENNGRLDVDAYIAGRQQLDQQFGVESDPNSLRDWATSINSYLDSGGRTIPTGIQPAQEEMSGLDTVRNSAVNNPIGAAFVGAVDGATGIPTALAGDQMAALSDSQFPAVLGGQVLGAVGATTGLGAAARLGASRFAPQLLGGGSKAQFGRNLATDATYGAGYTGITEGDPLSGAAYGTVGSVVGQPLGAALGRTLGGIPVSESVKALGARNIPMTTGQRLGGFAKAAEDKATSIPLVGDMINARRMEGLGAFNQRAFEDAGSSIGFAPTRTGKEGVQDLLGDPGNPGAVGQAYDQATAGANVPLDQQFLADIGAVGQQAQRLPADYRPLVGQALENRIVPITDAGALTGSNYQQAMRGLKAKRNSAGSATPGFEDEYRDVLSGTMDALTGLMTRGGGDNVVSGLANANAANRNAKILENATQRAKGGSGSGESYMFTPSQLQMSVQQSQRKYPGATPLENLADQGQNVLPSRIPDSGTAGRVAQMALPVGLGAGGAGVGYSLNGSEGAQTGALGSAALTALALAGGTKGGQTAINKMLFDRPDMLRNLGQGITRRRGLFGNAAVPLVIAAQ